MNEQNESENVPPIVAPATPDLSANKDLAYWAKRFLACNPFYLLSAALLLFGLSRVSVDHGFLEKELARLAFNLTSLQCYELLLVGTVIFLARRKIWYDSTLLVVLENMFLFVPFILISELSLLDTPTVWTVCPLCALIGASRIGGLKRFFKELNLPNGLLVLGGVLLLVNVGLLATYRVVGESKMGGKPDSGPDFFINQLTWLVILPAALALATFLPRAKDRGSLLPQRRWLPAFFFLLWIAVTGVHLYCLNYVYDFAFHTEMQVPVFWVLGWVAYSRLPEILASQSRALKYALAATPMLVPFLAASEYGTKIFFTLTALNALLYGGLCLLEHDNRFVRHLAFASAVLLVCGVPGDWVQFVAPQFHREYFIAAGLAAYAAFYIALSRNPAAGLFGSIAVTATMLGLFEGHAGAIHWSLQSGLVFLLLHSLRWDDSQHDGARGVRNVAAILWSGHALAWMHLGGAMWMPFLFGGIVLGTYVLVTLLQGRRDALIILPAASLVVILAGPGNSLFGTVRTTPTAVLAVIGSFVLFALGTVAALTKNRLHERRESGGG